MLLDPKENVQLQPQVLERDSGVNGGNYCMVFSATVVTPVVNISLFKVDLYVTPWQCFTPIFCNYEVADFMIALLSSTVAVMEAAQPKPVCQDQSMLASVWSGAIDLHIAH